jgi:hypothetical protein
MSDSLAVKQKNPVCGYISTLLVPEAVQNFKKNRIGLSSKKMNEARTDYVSESLITWDMSIK